GQGGNQLGIGKDRRSHLRPRPAPPTALRTLAGWRDVWVVLTLNPGQGVYHFGIGELLRIGQLAKCANRFRENTVAINSCKFVNQSFVEPYTRINSRVDW